MIKRLAAVFMSAILILCFIGCGEETDKSNLKTLNSNGVDIEAILEQQVSSDNADTNTDLTQQDVSETEQEKSLSQSADDPYSGNIDIDLTQMSSTMVYSEVFNMMSYADNYVGKVIRAEGEFAAYTDETTGKTYYAVVVADATACCSQGLEFVWNGEHTYPDDYPPVGSQIVVTGVFNIYEEYGYTYCQLSCDDVRPA